MRRLQILLQRGAIQLQLGSVQLVEGVAEVDQHQVALVPQQGVHRALPGLFRSARAAGCLTCDLLLARRAQFAPLRPAEAKHLMQYAQPFERERHGWQFGGYSLDSGISGDHSEIGCDDANRLS